MWSLLRDRRLVGIKFRRQVPIGRFVADFVCYEAKLVVELDGSQHAGSEYDKRRDAKLARRGFQVLRFWNADLFLQRDAILDFIFHTVEQRREASDARL
jgi:very-short-patch-repair endonuclease